MRMLNRLTVAVALVAGISAAFAPRLSTPILEVPAAHASGPPSTLTVTNTYDSGSCPATPGSQVSLSLRCAIAQANADGSGDTISFNIPPYECSGYQQGQTVTQPGQICTFTEVQPAYSLTANNTTIDGYTQAGSSPNTLTSPGQGDNADIAVELTGCTYASTSCPVPTGLTVSGQGDVIEGMAFDGTNVHFSASSSDSVLEGSFVGVTPDGNAANASPNTTVGGVDVSGGSSDTIGVDSSVSCGTGSSGPLCGADLIGGNSVGVTVEADPNAHTPATGTTVSDNVVGLAPNGSGKLGNNYGLIVSGTNTTIAGNLITNNSNGRYASLQLCSSLNGTASGEGDGLFISGTGSVNGNTVTGNQDNGIMVGCLGDTATHVVLSRNLVHDNGNLAVDLAPKGQVDCSPSPPGPNGSAPCPVIASASSSTIAGTACDNCIVEVFIASNGADEAQHGGSSIYLGSTTANGSGAWTLSGPFSNGATFDPSTEQVTATATTPSSPGPAETSEFALDFPQHVFTVTTTADNAPFTSCPNGPGGTGYTLRCAITDVVSQENNWGGTIAFDIPSADSGCDATTHVCKISLSNPLPRLTSLSTIVDGYSQPGAHPNTEGLKQGDNAAIKIQIDGTSAGGADGLTVTGPHDLVRGVSITGFSGSAVTLFGYSAQYDAVDGNFLGEAPDGTAAGNTNGVDVTTSAGNQGPLEPLIGGGYPDARNVIGSNQTSCCQSGSGVVENTQSAAAPAYSSIIQGNYIGTDPSGNAARPFGNDGVVAGSGDIIGGDGAGDGNLISGTSNSGIGNNGVEIAGSQVWSPLAPQVTVQGNEIGTNAAGTAALPQRRIRD